MSLKMNIHERNQRRSLVADQIIDDLLCGNLEVAAQRLVSRTKRETAALSVEVARRLLRIGGGDRLLGVLLTLLES